MVVILGSDLADVELNIFTWDTMARLTGDANVAFEITGGNHNNSQLFFENINPEVGSLWPIQRLMYIQERVMSDTAHSGIAGFQWYVYT